MTALAEQTEQWQRIQAFMQQGIKITTMISIPQHLRPLVYACVLCISVMGCTKHRTAPETIADVEIIDANERDSLHDDRQQHIRTAIEDKDFAAALQHLEHAQNIRPDDPTLLALRKTAQHAMREYLSHVRQDLEHLSQQALWQHTTRLLDDVALRLPSDDSALHTLRQQISTAHQTYTQQHRLQIYQLYAHYLPTVIPQLRALAKAQPNDRALRAELTRAKHNAATAAQALFEHGQHLYQQGKTVAAQHWLTLAARFKHNDANMQDTLQRLMTDIELATAQQQRQSQAADEQQQQQRIDRLVANIDDALNHEQIHTARTLYNTLTETAPTHPRNDEFLTQINVKTDQIVNTLIAKGKQQYSSGRYNDALAAWKQAIDYAPHNAQLNELITRVRKVIHNIDHLKRVN